MGLREGVSANDWSVKSFLFTSWWIWEERHPVHCIVASRLVVGVLSAPYIFVNFTVISYESDLVHLS